MEIDVPVDMTEVEAKVAELNEKGETVTVESVIMDTVLQSFQAYLEHAEAGHYDSAKLEDGKLNVYAITGGFMREVTPMGTDFVTDFKTNPDAVFFYLEEQAGKVAMGQ
ncbi:hypothetical protein LOSG293_550050 [Secundilactobacillus oryzae JCM 18671]|uniref:Uncharacterized protein n=1 Tax=Secundilactobacillus oryzae JCM 18671 TaxID=1291743 RepID=A0A081BL17_9LACO|nr:hypothetical protein [Secundilactobacillus oryzae]GAK48735.1 hypothetical protein LOSG293_550050 [Secundilactobacillus oryzae JCM 18671]